MDVATRRSGRVKLLGLREANPPSLEGVERRRLQLWGLTGFVIVAIGVASVLSGSELDPERFWWARPGAMRLALIALSLGFLAYAIEKELALRRLTRELIDERAVSAALTARVTELHALFEASKAVNAVLEPGEVLHIILSSALDLLDGAHGSVMLLRDNDTLEAVCVVGNDPARGVLVAVGEGIAGRVAATGDPLLISGIASTEDFPGLIERTNPVSSAMSVPLRNRDELLGVLNCNALDTREYDEYDLRAFTVFAEQAAAAIANARLYESEREHVSRLTELDSMKNEFIASVGHDLRTPLTSIIGSASVAKRPDLPDPSRHEMLDLIVRQAGKLEAMVQQLLDAASAGLPADDFSGPLDLTRHVETAVAAFAVRGIRVEVDAEGSCTVLGGPAVDRAIKNLLDNAIAHGAEPVRVSLCHDGTRVVCAVADAGGGIPEADRELVFERFWRGDPSRTTPGLGLGLPIVRQIARAHGGDAWAEDGRVCFSLPKV